MLQDLEAFLDASTTPELSGLILDTCNVLLEAGVDSHLFLLRNDLDLASTHGVDAALDNLQATLSTILIQTLAEFSVQVQPETDLRTLASIFKGIQLIDNWDDPETLNALTDAPEGNEAALADILEIVSDLSAGEYMNALASVSDSMIERIASLTDREVVGPQPDEVAVAAAQMRLRELFARDSFGEDSLFVHALDSGLRLGLPIEETFAPYLDQIHQLPLDHLPRELVAFAYASNAPFDTIPALLAKMKETFSLPLTDLLKLDADIKRLL